MPSFDDLAAKAGVQPITAATAGAQPVNQSFGMPAGMAPQAPSGATNSFDALAAKAGIKPVQQATAPAAPVDNRSGFDKFSDAVSAPIKFLSKYSGMDSLVGTMAKPFGEVAASGSELMGKQAPAWTNANRLSSPAIDNALKYGLSTPEARANVAAGTAADTANGRKGAGFGDVLNALTLLPGEGLAAEGVKGVQEASQIGRGGKLLPLLKEGAGTGAKWGAAYGAANAADQGGGLTEIGGGALKGGLTGAAVGAGASVLGAGVAKATSNFDKTAVRANEYTKTMEGLSKIEDNSKPVRDAIAKANSRGIDTKDILAQTNLLNGSVDSSGKIRTTQKGGAIEQLQNHIKPAEGIIKSHLINEGKTIPLATVEDKLRTNIDKSGLEGSALENAHSKITQEIKGLTRRADENGNLPLSSVQDAKTSTYKTINYANPETKIADKAVARTYKDIIQDPVLGTKSVDAKKLNDELAKHYATLGVLEKLDGKTIGGGKLGKYFAETVGGVVGSHFGPLGSIAGAETAGGIRGSMLKNTFTSKTGKALEHSPEMMDAIKSAEGHSNMDGSLNTSQSTTSSGTSNGISNSVLQIPEKSSAPPGTPDLSAIASPSAGVLEGQAKLRDVPQPTGKTKLLSQKAAKESLGVSAKPIQPDIAGLLPAGSIPAKSAGTSRLLSQDEAKAKMVLPKLSERRASQKAAGIYKSPIPRKK